LPHSSIYADPIASELHAVLAVEPLDMARAALVIARLEYGHLDPVPFLSLLDRLGKQAFVRLHRVAGDSVRARIAALNGLLFEDEGFSGNHAHYDDFRNSFLNCVLERRLGIPITLALVYMEVARRGGDRVYGVAFPGHFLMRVPARGGSREEDDVIIDPFDGGAELDEADCRRLLARHLGPVGEDTPFDPALLQPCTPRHMLARMLNNLKRTYVELRSFPQARRVSNLLLAVEPTMLSELRDRGLLSYHLNDLPSALGDLEDYLRLHGWKGDAELEERDQILEHVKALRRRVAAMN
jgi:regulator of sirC expression with transglutaminase-like and TPR domain